MATVNDISHIVPRRRARERNRIILPTIFP